MLVQLLMLALCHLFPVSPTTFSELRPQRLEAVANLRMGGPRPEAVHELLQVQPRAHAHQGGWQRRSEEECSPGKRERVGGSTAPGVAGTVCYIDGTCVFLSTSVSQPCETLERCVGAVREECCWEAGWGANEMPKGLMVENSKQEDHLRTFILLR